jgi:glycosyltransferase involved in cell wall biosynthesis
MVLVSVAMLSYNHEKYIGEAIESVLNQTVQDLELIVVDDGSRDNSRHIIKEYSTKDPRVKPIFHERNFGIPRGANDCLKNATGEYFGFIGSDDLWVPSKTEKQLKVIEKNPEKIVWSEGQIIDSNGKLKGGNMTELLYSPVKKSGNIFQELLREDFIFGQSLLVKTEIAQKYSFNESLRYVNDHQYFIDLSKEHEFVFMPESLALYRLHGQNTTSKNMKLWFKERIMLRNYLIQKYGPEISQQSLADIYYKIGHAYAGLEEKELAKYFYTKAVLVDPIRSHTPLYIILALTNGEGFIGGTLQSSYNKVLMASAKFLS